MFVLPSVQKEILHETQPGLSAVEPHAYFCLTFVFSVFVRSGRQKSIILYFHL